MLCIKQHDVLICGADPVGLSVALELVRPDAIIATIGRSAQDMTSWMNTHLT